MECDSGEHSSWVSEVNSQENVVIQMSESSHESDQQNDETWKAVEAKLLTD